MVVAAFAFLSSSGIPQNSNAEAVGIYSSSSVDLLTSAFRKMLREVRFAMACQAGLPSYLTRSENRDVLSQVFAKRVTTSAIMAVSSCSIVRVGATCVLMTTDYQSVG